MGYVQLLLIALVISVVCATVLYRAARASGRRPALWATIGFFLNVIGLVIWYVVVGSPARGRT